MTARVLQGMLTIEAFLDKNSKPKVVFSQEEIKQINRQISQELAVILPQLDDSSYAIVGGLFQSSELLQPGFPIHSQLRQYANAALKGENNRRNQLIIGANKDGELPEGLRQNTQVQQTPLFLLPFVIITENDATKTTFEQQLMHKGMASKDLLLQLQNLIGVKLRHVNFMTVLDLAAMMHNHLQMAGFDEMWQLLEQAIFNRQPETKVITPQHNEFYLSKKIVFTPFFSYIFWANSGPGQNEKEAQLKYLHYTQVQRQYVATLQEHGLDVRQFVPNSENYPLDEQHICFATLEQSRIAGNFLHEIIQPIADKSKAKLNKNTHQHLGVLFYQLEDAQGGLEFYYPLNPQGIAEIEELVANFD